MDIAKLVATEQFILSCPDDLAVHLKQSSYNSSEDMCDAASLFLHARGRKLAKTKKTNTKRMENTPAGSMHAEQGSKSDGACFICKDKSHIARNCPRRGKKYCSHCKMNNHNTSDCRKYGGRSVHAAAAIATTQNKTVVTDPGISSKVEEPTEITVNGKKFVNAAVCKNGPNFKDGGTAIFDAEVNGQRATVMRDTGCGCIVVNAKYVQPQHLTGESVYLNMADASVREAQWALISVRSPFYNGVVKAAVMDKTICDLLIGNVDGARSADRPLENWKDCAVTTRAQAVKEKSGDKPLMIDSNANPLSIGKDEIARLQG
ncbi:hypothetical protein EB796_008489 [Bugula neritina]|uniref:CCHC-type domain-containing protein n=1 Tax=Bugula neritina TaxID=10212 RepID=A0A7J7K6M2_BUGNE|nr:hypothetical protein EB796_008489 [Bugula neritina]